MARENLVVSCLFLQMCPLSSEEDLVEARASAKMHAADLSFSIINQTKVVTATSELGRNVLEHGSGGSLRIERVNNLDQIGLRLTFVDHGPGIENMELALTDGYTSKHGLGLGLSGSKRLMDEFEIQSTVGQGTTVVVTKWK